MNIFILTLIIFVIIWIFLSWFSKTSSKKISKAIRSTLILFAAGLAILMVFAGRYLFSVPFLMMILPLIKTKAGISLLQLIRIWGLLRILKQSGRFDFKNFSQTNNTQMMNVDEAYKILNLDSNKRYTKDEVLYSYKKIMKKIHPDISPELERLASIVNEAKDTILKTLA
jgi:hypothetical protein|tara:strand:+ start:95 stop:604 length:510 start_codon:yes stop_codon:yes gene_type:complete